MICAGGAPSRSLKLLVQARVKPKKGIHGAKYCNRTIRRCRVWGTVICGYNIVQWFRSDPRRQLKRHCAEIIPAARLLGIPDFPSTLLITDLTMVEQLLTESIPIGVTRHPLWAMACCSCYDRAAQNRFMPKSIVSTWSLGKTESSRLAAKPDLPYYTALNEGNLQIHAIAVFAVETFKIQFRHPLFPYLFIFRYNGYRC